MIILPKLNRKDCQRTVIKIFEDVEHDPELRHRYRLCSFDKSLVSLSTYAIFINIDTLSLVHIRVSNHKARFISRNHSLLLSNYPTKKKLHQGIVTILNATDNCLRIKPSFVDYLNRVLSTTKDVSYLYDYDNQVFQKEHGTDILVPVNKQFNKFFIASINFGLFITVPSKYDNYLKLIAPKSRVVLARNLEELLSTYAKPKQTRPPQIHKNLIATVLIKDEETVVYVSRSIRADVALADSVLCKETNESNEVIYLVGKVVDLKDATKPDAKNQTNGRTTYKIIRKAKAHERN